jgi:wobble nucleotide-excising tRNase
VKITRLDRLRGYRIFRSFEWPGEGLPEFGRYNLVYGWNGTGKTSLSTVFRHLQRRQVISDGDVRLSVDNNRIGGADVETATLPDVRVFSRDTVDRAVFEIVGQQLPPVFVLGEDSAEKQRRVEELRKKVAKLASEELRAQGKKDAAQSALEALCTERARSIKNLLTLAGGGPYNNYDARNFKAAVARLYATEKKPELLTDAKRERHLSQKEGRLLEKLPELSLPFPDLTALTARVTKLLEETMVSRTLPELVENAEIASWVGTGLSLHVGGRATDNCRFCGQHLPADRLRQLEDHFNDEFKRFQAEAEQLAGDLRAARDSLDRFQPPQKAALYAHLQRHYGEAASQLNVQGGLVKQYLDALWRAVEGKRASPFKPLNTLDFLTHSELKNGEASALERVLQVALAGGSVVASVFGKSAYEAMSALIAEHNMHCDNFQEEVRRSREVLEGDEVLRALPEWDSRRVAVDSAASHLAKIGDEIASVKKEVAELERDVLEHRRPAEELNAEMAAYLGRDELRFEVEKSGYRITRNGEPATHLSDGERTAIAFMYFLKSLQARDFNLKSGVVVIDDPVSSLDANSLYSAFGFMKQRTAEVGQLFVLTHNFTFFRQVLNWFRHLPGQKKKDMSQRPARYYMLASEMADGRRTAVIKPLDRFLHEYESEYHYLFKRVIEESEQPLGQGLEAYYSAPNVARRVLESFLAFRAPDIPGDLFDRLETVEFDQAKKTRILRFLHTYSHMQQVPEPGHDLSLLSEAPAILKDLLALIRAADVAHYERMLAVVRPSAAEEVQA